jgi:hypothetical protein
MGRELWDRKSIPYGLDGIGPIVHVKRVSDGNETVAEMMARQERLLYKQDLVLRCHPVRPERPLRRVFRRETWLWFAALCLPLLLWVVSHP